MFSGLGETYISYARSSLHQDFHGRAIGYIQNAIIVLARYFHLLSLFVSTCIFCIYIFYLYAVVQLNVMAIFHASGNYLVMLVHLPSKSTRAMLGV